MGVHTGDSITVAPAQTLTDKEYQIMRDAALRIIREIGVETGGSNIQFAVNPEDGRMVVIEMNPRVSRSSALACKATGFPIAKIAAKLASVTRWTKSATTSPAKRRPVLSRRSIMWWPKFRALLSKNFPRPKISHATDEIGGRSDGDRPDLQGIVAESVALTGNRLIWLRAKVDLSLSDATGVA